MSFEFIVIPRREDQSFIEELLQDELPDTFDMSDVERVDLFFHRTFENRSEADQYAEGFRSITDCMVYELIESKPTEEHYIIDGDHVIFTVNNDAERNAIAQGLEDADGWVEPKYYDNFSDDTYSLSDFSAVREIFDTLTRLRAEAAIRP